MYPSIAVVVITFNEELNLPFFFDGLKGFANEIFVLDSYSTDRTVDICKLNGASVFYREFDDFSSQRHYALTSLPITSEWILVLDADEYLTNELKHEIRSKISCTNFDAFMMKRRFVWQGKWLKHGYYPTWLLRLGRNGLLDCDSRPINEHLICLSDRVGKLDHDFVDHNRKSLNDWISKHNHYSDREAKALLLNDSTKYSLFASQYSRKRWLRNNIWNKLPLFFRPFVLFIYRYFIMGGFLDGKKAFIYHFLHAFIYRMLIDIKFIEARDKNDHQ